MRLVIACLVLTLGCSFIGQRVPAPSSPPSRVKCSLEAPALDLGVGLSAAAIAGTTVTHTADEAVPRVLVIGIPMMIIAATFLASATYGLTSTSRCEAVRHAAELEIASCPR